MTSSAAPRPIRVLLVDDHGIVREGLRAYLELELDIDVVGEARDGQEAVRRAQELKPDVVLMDLVMPNTGGIELFAEMLAQPDLRSIPVITMSGLKVDMRLPSRAHLEKPFTLAEFVDALRKATGRPIAHQADSRGSRTP